MQAVDHRVTVEAKPCGENSGTVSRLAFVTGENASHISRPGTGRHRGHARPTAIIEWPIGNRHIRINPDIRMRYEEDRWQW
jgi:hypothetical protein